MENIWERKYSVVNTQVEKLYYEDLIKGLEIWNWAYEAKDKVKQFAFLEIRDGKTTSFW